MTRPWTNPRCTDLLYLAAAADHGIVVKVFDPKGALSNFYSTRQGLGDADLPGLKFNISPTGSGELWIWHDQRPTAPGPTNEQPSEVTPND